MKHENGKNIIEEKPVNITNIGSVRKFEIMFQHSSIYNFYNSEELLVDEFLLNVKKQN